MDYHFHSIVSRLTGFLDSLDVLCKAGNRDDEIRRSADEVVLEFSQGSQQPHQ